MNLRFLASVALTVAISASATAAVFAQTKPMSKHYLPDVKIDQRFVTAPKFMSKNASGTQIV